MLSPPPARARRRRPRRRVVVLALALAALAAGLAVARRVIDEAPPPRPVAPEAALDRPAERPLPPAAPIPPDEWSERFRRLQDAEAWRALDRHLAATAEAYREEFAAGRLGYLWGRVALAQGDHERALRLLAPYLESGPFADLALFHTGVALAARGDAEGAIQAWQRLVVSHPRSVHAAEALDGALALLDESGTAERTFRFVEAVGGEVAERRRRELEARLVEVFVEQEDYDAALSLGLRLLADGTADDAAEVVAIAFDRPAVLALLSAEQVLTVGETLRSHRRFGRAVELLEVARARLPARRTDIDFSIGRAEFFAEDFAAAREAYLRGAAGAARAQDRSRFFYHAARCAQLLGEQRAAEELLGRAIAAHGSSAAATAALDNRLRIRVAEGRFGEAARDLRSLASLDAEAFVEASMAYATSLVLAGRSEEGRAALAAIPARARPAGLVPEIDYWQARSWEDEGPEEAVEQYLWALRAEAPSHFRVFARQRLSRPPLAEAVATLLERRRAEAWEHLTAGRLDEARRAQTDVVLLASRPEPGDLEVLAQIYARLPPYARILGLEPYELPSFPLEEGAGRGELLMAMGLFDEAAPEIVERYPLGDPRSSLTQSLALRLGEVGRGSILAAEVLMNSVPDDYVFELLPRTLQHLLYPRFFQRLIYSEAELHGADPRLMQAIMREESRFDPRAKSFAAARGLMQFVITTAQDVGSDLGLARVAPADLYQPRIVIRLGARYVGDLLDAFDGDPYAVAAAYNAGPNQSRLWRHLAPGDDPDAFLSNISFDETRNYVRKVLDSYDRYGQLYGTRARTRLADVEP